MPSPLLTLSQVIQGPETTSVMAVALWRPSGNMQSPLTPWPVHPLPLPSDGVHRTVFLFLRIRQQIVVKAEVSFHLIRGFKLCFGFLAQTFHFSV